MIIIPIKSCWKGLAKLRPIEAKQQYRTKIMTQNMSRIKKNQELICTNYSNLYKNMNEIATTINW